MINKVVIVGVANSGKTTLFNGLTNSSERVGNWYGVTTSSVEKDFNIGKKRYTAVDLPGSYVDGNFTLESNSLLKYLNDKNSTCVVLCEALNLKKGLLLLKKIKSCFNKIILVVNMYQELKRLGGFINFDKLQKSLNVNVVNAECNTKQGINAVKNALSLQTNNGKVEIDDDKIDFIIKNYFDCGKTKISLFDNLLLNSFLSYPFLIVAFCTILYLAFGKYGIGCLLGNAFEYSFNLVICPIERFLTFLGANNFIKSFALEGVLQGFLGILVFIPQLAVLSLGLNFLEQSGIMARLAFTCDRLFSIFGLTGRSVFTLLSGYGCTAMAVLTANGLENKDIKKRVVFSLPFISCSAKTPVYLYVLSMVGCKFGFLVLLGIFVLGFILALIFAGVNNAVNNKPSESLIIEFPPYRIPKINNTLKALQIFLKKFIIKVASVVVIVCMALWLLKNLSCDFKYLQGQFSSNSLIARLGQYFKFIFYPIGLDNWQLTVAVICGLFAKEGVVASLIVCGSGYLTLNQGIAFLVFCAVYPPCIVSLSTIASELGIISFIHTFVCQFILALIACYLTYYLGIIFALIIIALYVVLLKRKKIKIKKCSGCINERNCGYKTR